MNDCTCDHGWRPVSDRWIEQQVPWPDQPPESATDGVLTDYAEAVEQVRLRRAAHRNTVYPCKSCRPGLFFRWAGGHLEPDHDRADCDQCREVRRGRPVEPSTPAPTHYDEPEPRRDIYT